MKDAVTVTQAAKNYINERLFGERLLLVKVNNKGCSGHSIEYDMIDESSINRFDEVVRWPEGGLVIHASSVMGLLGSTLDVKSNMIENYLIWENPNADNHCGCGSSFELKECSKTE